MSCMSHVHMYVTSYIGILSCKVLIYFFNLPVMVVCREISQ